MMSKECSEKKFQANSSLWIKPRVTRKGPFLFCTFNSPIGHILSSSCIQAELLKVPEAIRVNFIVSNTIISMIK